MLYLHPAHHEASPKAISRRTSYLRVRLEFLPYPHLIPTLFNGCGSGPPLPLTAASSWTWVGHPVSGLQLLTLRPIKTWFPSGSMPEAFNLASTRNSPDRSTKSTRSTFVSVPQFVNTGFQVLFHSPPGVLFTFPSQYSALSVTEEYLALRGGPRSFPQGFPCPVVLWILPRFPGLRLRGFHPLRPVFPGPFPCPFQSLVQSEPRSARTAVWALPVPLAATPGIDVSFSSSGYLDVSVRRVPFHALWIQAWIHGVFPCGFPHSDIRGSPDICSSPRLFAAYHVFRRLSVPRHPPCALSCLTSLPCLYSVTDTVPLFLYCLLLLRISICHGSLRCLHRPRMSISLQLISFLDLQYSVFKVRC